MTSTVWIDGKGWLAKQVTVEPDGSVVIDDPVHCDSIRLTAVQWREIVAATRLVWESPTTEEQ